MATLFAFEVRYDVPMVFASPPTAARLIERWAAYFAREAVVAINDLWRSTASETCSTCMSENLRLALQT